MSTKETGYILKYRKKIKDTLIKEHGGKCVDCGFTGPAYAFDFDHLDPATKIQPVSQCQTMAKARAEAAKCELVCAICHRGRTHRRVCRGCDDCGYKYDHIINRKSKKLQESE